MRKTFGRMPPKQSAAIKERDISGRSWRRLYRVGGYRALIASGEPIPWVGRTPHNDLAAHRRNGGSAILH
jgi:hypothetical protein